jgi:hypothetical protein
VAGLVPHMNAIQVAKYPVLSTNQGSRIGAGTPHSGIAANVRRVPAEYGTYGGLRPAPVGPDRLEGTNEGTDPAIFISLELHLSPGRRATCFSGGAISAGRPWPTPTRSAPSSTHPRSHRPRASRRSVRRSTSQVEGEKRREILDDVPRGAVLIDHHIVDFRDGSTLDGLPIRAGGCCLNDLKGR